ncbi:MATE family efflux transporter [bacterium]|nr:MATE family efflux transporter [bacterium]
MWLIEAVFIGRLSAAALGGVGFALQIILVTMTLLLTFVMGSIIVINRHLGSKDRWGANHIFGQSVMASFLLSIPIGIIWYFGAPQLFQIIREQEILTSVSAQSISGIESGIQYLRIVALATPIMVTNFVCVGLIRGAGDTHVSMKINLTMNLTNAILTPILIYGWFGFARLEVRGAAIAMVIAHSLGFAMSLIFLRRRKCTLFLAFSEITTPRWESFKLLFKMGLPTTVEQMVWSGGQLIVTGFVATMGINELAIHQIFLRIQGVLSMFYLGFGLAAMTQVGQNIGANAHHRAEHTSRMTQRIVLVFGLIVLTLMVLFYKEMMHLFIRKEDISITAFSIQSVFFVFALVQAPKAMNTVITGSLRGAGDIQWLMWINIITVLVFELGSNYVGTFIIHFGLIGIWGVQCADEIIKSIINYSRFKSGKWKLIRI